MKHLTIPELIIRARKANHNLSELSVQVVQSWWLVTGLIWAFKALTGGTAATLPPEFNDAMWWAFVIVVLCTIVISCTLGSVSVALRLMRRAGHRRLHSAPAARWLV